MFKVMIVDDEPMIRQGLQTIVEWERYNFDVCAVASNGVEALEKYKEHQPDLILIDIRMPIMDGLKTISELRKLGSKSRFLILSGYGEFQYAQQAIRFRVDGYILKPIDEVELTLFIDKISRDLQAKQQEQEISEHTLGLLKEEWLKDFISSDLTDAELTSEHWQRLFTVQEQDLSLILIDTYSREHSLTVRNQIKQQLTEFIKEQGWGEVFSNENYIGILSYHIHMNSSKQERIVEQLLLACGDNVYFVALASEQVQTIQALYDQVSQMKKGIKQRFFLQENQLYTIDMVESLLTQKSTEEDNEAVAAIVEQASQRLFYSIDVGNKDLVDELLEQTDEQLRKLGLTEQQIKNNWAQLLTVVMNRLSSIHPKLQLEQDLKVVTQLYLAHHNQRMLAKLKEQLHSIIERLNQTESSNTTVMKQMTDFIDRHYMEPLRLETMAEIFNYNSGYLGKLFKNHCGENFNTYLDHVRIDRAIELLQEGKKVHQVAELVGYANVDYFHSKFKKYKGVSPSAYKPGGKQNITK